MLLNRIYYQFKPIIPWSIRVWLRRWLAKRRRVSCAHIWPIDPRSGTPPPGWPGWPEGKRFAFVLTHDVEGLKGLGRIEQLMELEAKYDFRSSFNLVPEGEYRVPDTLRASIEKAGFEIGVHGLSHDGKLYGSKEAFAASAARIRAYAQEWKAVGFRSPLMQHELGWLHLLKTEYDSSTFDTDPFEPEPDGLCTIFPFWVPGPGGGGYVELPYSLVQDFNLFHILREQTTDIWKRKLDWIAERGGMALLNTHPDYMCFEGQCARDEYPVSHYEEFLRYAMERYGDIMWHALPRQVSRFHTANRPPGLRNSRKRICMIAYTNYESDNRVRRYAEALADRGDLVEVISLSSGNIPLGEEIIGGVKVHRIQRRDFREDGLWSYVWPLLRFFASASRLVARRQKEIRYDLVHIHNVPDFLVFAAWRARLDGAKLILDIHDIVPELFADKFKEGLRSLPVRFLKLIEKASTGFVDHVIISNHLWLETLASRSVAINKCSVYVNQVDSKRFFRRTRTRDDGRLIILFPGTFQWHQGLDIAIEAMAHLKYKIPNAELHLYGGGGGLHMKAELAALAERLGVGDKVKFCGGVPIVEVAQVIANADIGVVPKRADSFGNEAYSTKIMEFMSQGIPVVASRTKIDSYYFNDELLRFFPSGDSRALADAILEIATDSSRRERLIKAGLDHVQRNYWEQSKEEYLRLVDFLTTELFIGSELSD